MFTDRLLATLVSLCHGTTHDVLACWFGMDRSIITRAIGEVRPLLAQRGCIIAPDVRLLPRRGRRVTSPAPIMLGSTSYLGSCHGRLCTRSLGLP
ncbi:transposase family protein [Streptomyces sp. BF23-18]|uniref:helix-turn-helix domain-containing protein n=1 Tax=Streptomyces sp. BF23-18 TaxID=3240282 RepID=UPI0034E53FE8